MSKKLDEQEWIKAIGGQLHLAYDVTHREFVSQTRLGN